MQIYELKIYLGVDPDYSNPSLICQRPKSFKKNSHFLISEGNYWVKTTAKLTSKYNVTLVIFISNLCSKGITTRLGHPSLGPLQQLDVVGVYGWMTTTLSQEQIMETAMLCFTAHLP